MKIIISCSTSISNRLKKVDNTVTPLFFHLYFTKIPVIKGFLLQFGFSTGKEIKFLIKSSPIYNRTIIFFHLFIATGGTVDFT